MDVYEKMVKYTPPQNAGQARKQVEQIKHFAVVKRVGPG